MSDEEDKETAVNLKLIISFARLAKSLEQALTPEIKEQGLTPTQFGVLEALYHKGPLTINQIIEKTLSSSGNMGIVIANLEKSGWVIKERSETDGRCRRVALTADGRSLIAHFFPRHVESLNRVLSGLDLQEKENLSRQMKKLSLSIGAIIKMGDTEYPAPF